MADLGHTPYVDHQETPLTFEVRGPELPRGWKGVVPCQSMRLCSTCRCLYAPRGDDDLVCPQKMMKVLKERVL